MKVAVIKIYWLSLLLILPVIIAIYLMSVSKPGLVFERSSYANLTGWQTDNLAPALTAFSRSCEKLLLQKKRKRLPGAHIGGRAGDWHLVCTKAMMLVSADYISSDRIRSFFESEFTPISVSINGNKQGMFTGYFEPLLMGSKTSSKRYNVPLFMRPPELVMVDLGSFRPDLKGRRIAGKVEGGRLIPFPSRGKIDKGALSGRGLELVFVDDPIAAFSLHIQGSGRVQMDDGRMLRVGYAAQNGHPYSAIGRDLVKMGAIKKGEISMPAIRAWLSLNPDKAAEVMAKNASYIFFRELGNATPDEGPYGSAGVALTPRRSLAVDRKHLSLHMPIWLSASHPDPTDREGEPLPMNRLMVAQDTGGAIRGAIRGDVFWGFGGDAQEIAGRMANFGTFSLLLPNALAAKKIPLDD